MPFFQSNYSIDNVTAWYNPLEQQTFSSNEFLFSKFYKKLIDAQLIRYLNIGDADLSEMEIFFIISSWKLP